MRNLTIVLFAFLLQVQGISQVRYWVSAASVRADFWDMFRPEAKWDTLLSLTDVFSIHVNGRSNIHLHSDLGCA